MTIILTLSTQTAVRQQIDMNGPGKTKLMKIDQGTDFLFLGLIPNPYNSDQYYAIVQAGVHSAPFAILFDQNTMTIHGD